MVGVELPGALMVICPVQLPACKLAVFNCTLSDPGVAPLCGETTSQLPPHVVVLAFAENGTVDPLAEVIFRICGGGAPVPV